MLQEFFGNAMRQSKNVRDTNTSKTDEHHLLMTMSVPDDHQQTQHQKLLKTS